MIVALLAGLLTATDAGPPPLDLSSELEALRADAGVVALAALEYRDGRVVAVAAAGRRAPGADERVGLDDRWHLASCMKANTALLAAISVERGELRWDTTLAQAFPRVRVRPELRGVTLEQLLHHRSGLARDFSRARYALIRRGGAPRALRREAVEALLADAPAGHAGDFAYSNAGYVVAGTMLEAAADAPYEALLEQRIFVPLGIKSCRFGLPTDVGGAAPSGNLLEQGKVRPANGFDTAVTTPAGSTSCTLRDWARLAEVHLRGARGEGVLVSPATFRRLQTPPHGGEYAMGWSSVRRDWSNGVALTHGGALAGYQSLAWVMPGLGSFTLVAANQLDDDGVTASAMDRTARWIRLRLTPAAGR